MPLTILIMLVESRTPISKILISHHHSRFHFQRRTLSALRREIAPEIGFLRLPLWTAILAMPFQTEDVSIAVARSMNALSTVRVARLTGSPASSLVYLS